MIVSDQGDASPSSRSVRSGSSFWTISLSTRSRRETSDRVSQPTIPAPSSTTGRRRMLWDAIRSMAATSVSSGWQVKTSRVATSATRVRFGSFPSATTR